MKIKNLLLISATSIMMLTGCCISHEWNDATCEEPQTCEKCGKTEGEALEHEWVDATCEDPQTCELCGETKGKALGHDWVDATCEEPKTCEECGETKGEALGHDWQFATVDAPKTCLVCGETEGNPIEFKTLEFDFCEGYDRYYIVNEDRIVAMSRNASHNLEFDVYDMEGNKISSFTSVVATADGGWAGNTYFTFDNYVVVAHGDSYNVKEGIFEFYTLDGQCENIVNLPIKSVPFNFNKTWPTVIKSADESAFEVYSEDKTKFVGAYDINKHEWIDAEDYEIPEVAEIEYGFDTEKWAYISDYNEAIDGYLVEDAETEEWGFIDSNGNVLGMYMDACAYTKNGYALVSNDRLSYDLIDKDGNIVGEGVIDGTGSWYDRDSDLLGVDVGESSVMCYVVD